jgi:hypothetical protein
MNGQLAGGEMALRICANGEVVGKVNGDDLSLGNRLVKCRLRGL